MDKLQMIPVSNVDEKQAQNQSQWKIANYKFIVPFEKWDKSKPDVNLSLSIKSLNLILTII